MASDETIDRPPARRSHYGKRHRSIRGIQATKIQGNKLRPAVSEADFLATVIELATLCGWLVYHTYDSRRSQAGFPDLVLVRGGRLVFAELKTAKGPVRPAQQRWLKELEASGVEAFIWRPKDWEEIEQLLTNN